MRRQSILVLATIVCLVSVANVASAAISNIRGIEIDFVTIGNAGNPGDTRAEANPTGCGAVGYEYRIGKYEVTNAQWYDFVAAAGAPNGNRMGPFYMNAYNESSSFTGDNIPTNYISWYEAAQFCNYLTSGDKSQGAYQFSGNNTNPRNFEGIDRDSAVSTYGIVYVLPTEDEWYKAAYYKPDGSGYSTYANGTDIAPIAGDDANYDQVIGWKPWEVGVGNGTQEQNGTFDMMGNLIEWNETPIGPYNGHYDRGIRGGSFGNNSLTPSNFGFGPSSEVVSFGFRVASVPEPCSLVSLSLGGLTLMRRRRVR